MDIWRKRYGHMGRVVRPYGGAVLDIWGVVWTYGGAVWAYGGVVWTYGGVVWTYRGDHSSMCTTTIQGLFWSKIKVKVFFVPFNSQGHIGTDPQHCHLWGSNPQRGMTACDEIPDLLTSVFFQTWRKL